MPGKNTIVYPSNLFQSFSEWLGPILLLTVIGCSVRKSEPVKQKAFVPQNERIANGEKVYMRYCQSRHPAGEGGLGPLINANLAPQFVKRFKMRHGSGVMPGFKKSEISKNDLRDISKFLKAWEILLDFPISHKTSTAIGSCYIQKSVGTFILSKTLIKAISL